MIATAEFFWLHLPDRALEDDPQLDEERPERCPPPPIVRSTGSHRLE